MHLTSFCIWDALKMSEYFDAEQIIITSASGKTGSGLGYALQADKYAPKVIGMTSKRNLEMVKSLNLYDQCATYKGLTEIDLTKPTAIVDMAGNAKVMAALHTALGNNMKWTINVGMTHVMNVRPHPGIITERSKFFFAPGHIQQRMKDWGPEGFNQKTGAFLMETAMKTQKWLKFRKIDGLQGLAEIHHLVFAGQIDATEGLIVEM